MRAAAPARSIAYKPLLDEAIRLAQPQARRGAARRSRPGADGARRRARRGLRRRCASATSTTQVPCAWLDSDPPELHALHQRHDRPPEGRAARHRRLRGGAGGEHEAHLLRPRRRDLLLDQRHRLGRRPQLHRLRAADRRHGDDPVRRPADPARRRHLVAAGREVPGHRDVHRADRDPRAEEAGPEVPARSTTCRACARCSSPASRSTSRPRRGSPTAIGKPVIDNYWQTESGWPILTRRQRRRAERRASSAAPACRCTATTSSLVDEATGDDIAEPDQKGVVAIDGPTPPGFMQTVWRDDARFVDTYWTSIAGPPASTTPSTGASATTTATTSSSAAPTT